MTDRFYLGAQSVRLYLGDHIISTGAELIPKTVTENGVYNALSDNVDGYDSVTVNVPQPIMGTRTLGADLTHYTSGQTDLGNGFTITNASGIVGVGSETVDGVTYSGLEMSGAANFQTKRQLSDQYDTVEFNMIITAVSGDMRIISTGGVYFELSVWASTSQQYLMICEYGSSAIIDREHLVNLGDHNYADTSLPLSSLIDEVLKIKYVNDGTHVTLYINDVAKVAWTLAKANAQISTYGLNVGANSLATPTMLAVKAEYSGQTISWQGKTWIPM